MAIKTADPVLVSMLLEEQLRSVLVYRNLMNTRYQGEFNGPGSSVIIPSVGPGTVSDYTPMTDMTIESINTSSTVLQITEDKAFNFGIDKADALFNAPDLLAAAFDETTYEMAYTMDAFYSSLYVDIAAANTDGSDGSPVTIDKDNAYDKLVNLAKLLSKAKVPKVNRFAVIPPDYWAALMGDDRFALSPNLDASIAFTSGQVKMIAGMQIIESTTVPNVAGDKFKVIAGYPGMWTRADRLVSAEPYEPQKQFTSAWKGRYLYGAKMPNGNKGALMVCTF